MREKLTPLQTSFARHLSKVMGERFAAWGDQRRVAKRLGISVSYMNTILHERAGTTEEFRRKACNELGLIYDVAVGVKTEEQLMAEISLDKTVMEKYPWIRVLIEAAKTGNDSIVNGVLDGIIQSRPRPEPESLQAERKKTA